MTGLPPQERSWDDLLGPERDPLETVEEARRVLGLDARKVRHQPDLPDVGDLRAALFGED